MKRLAVIVVAGCSATGCIIATNNNGFCGDGVVDTFEQCDDGNTVDGDGCSSTCQIELATMTSSWTFKTLATNTITGCPDGFDTAQVIAQGIDANGMPMGSQITAKFNCAALTGVTDGLPFGTYDASIAITNTDGTNTYATSLTTVVDLTTGSRTMPVQTILNDGGYFHATWILKGATSNATLTCAQANNPDSIIIRTTAATATVATEDNFPCAAGDGFTSGFVAGGYSLSIDAETNQTPLGTPTALPAETILDRNRVSDLGNVTLLIDGQ